MKSSASFPWLRSSKTLPAGKLRQVYRRLFDHFGPQHWWPGETPFEVIIGAILTQNTAWTNVERAIQNLKVHRVLDPASLSRVPLKTLASWIRPAGYFNVKAARLRAFLEFLDSEFRGDLHAMFRLPGERLRPKLLSVKGIGPETADSILLYAAGKPFFVIDAYTRRIFLRHALTERPGRTGAVRRKLSLWKYDDWQRIFSRHLPQQAPLFNEFHALIVALAKKYCKSSSALCSLCPLKDFL